MLELGTEQITPRTAKAGSPHYYSAADYHELYKSGKLTPLQVAETLLGLTSAAAEKKSPYQDAWADSHGADHLALEAAKASTERYAAGKPLSVLDGVPIGVKDDLAVAGYVSHQGMKHKDIPWFATKKETAWPVAKLQEAGAVVIGKNRMHELGSDTTGLNVAQGTPTNHLNTKYYPGGSSSGAGSSLGAGVVPIAIGTDAGGSVRIPAAFNGVYSLKPSQHRTVFVDMTMCVVGPLAANARDLTTVYRLMSQPDVSCSIQSKFAISKPLEASAKRYIGIYKDWWKPADERVKDVCQKAIDYFVKEKGYEVVDITLPYIDEAQLAHGPSCLSFMAESARCRPENPADWLSLVGAANRVMLTLGSKTSAADLMKYNSLRTILMRHLAYLWQKYPGMLVLSPTTPLIGWARHAADDSYGMSDGNTSIRNMMYVFMANMTGAPAVVAPVGYVDPEQGEGKLPISMMAMGEWGSEEELLAWAGRAEQYLHDAYEGGRRRPDTWLDVIKEASKATAPE